MIDYKEPDFTDLPGRRNTSRGFKKRDVILPHIDVSVVTPYFNTKEEFFDELYVSLRLQTLQNWEWIVVDDGSTDIKAINRLAEIKKIDSRIKVVNQVNGGTAAARNTGFQNSSGRYICLHDHDDMLEPTYLEKCAWFLDSHTEFAFCNSYSVVFGEQNFLWTTGYERGKAFLQANSGPPLSVIRREAWIDCGGFDAAINYLYEDWDFWLAMAKAGHWGHTLPEFLQWYRKLGKGRYEQILESGYDNNEFAKMMQQKYVGLEQHFPDPAKKHPQPFEAIETLPLVSNPLEKNQTGRRILFIVPWMVTGGADQVNLDLIEGLVDAGHDITLCATLATDHRLEPQFSRFTADIFVLPNFLSVSDYPRFLAYLIQSRQIDTVVITGSTLGYQFLPYLRAVSPNVAFVDMCHVEEPHWLNGGHPRFAVGYQDVLDLNIVTTSHLSLWMQGRGADATRISVMHTGVRPAKVNNRDAIREELGIPLDVPLIIFAGRICAQKRPMMLAEIFKQARNQSLKFVALVIGDGEQKSQLEELITQFNLGDIVRMLGSVPHQRWLDILGASDILLMPSQYEGISVALLESMAAGVVPIVAEVGGQHEVVMPDVGILVPHGVNELQEYVAALSRLLTNRSELQQMSLQCKVIATSKISYSGMIDNFVSFLESAHRFRVEQPRYSIGSNFGRELATLALENKRLGDAVDWLWNTQSQSQHSNAPLLMSITEAQAFAKLGMLFSQTWLGRMIVRSTYLKSIAKGLLKKLEK